METGSDPGHVRTCIHQEERLSTWPGQATDSMSFEICEMDNTNEYLWEKRKMLHFKEKIKAFKNQNIDILKWNKNNQLLFKDKQQICSKALMTASVLKFR